MNLYRLRSARVAFADGTGVSLPDLAIAPGERVAVVGPNGSGKTTLLRVLAFLETPQGEFTAGVTPRDVGFVPQRPYLFRGTVATNLALALDGRSVSRLDASRRVVAALDRLGASHLATRRRAALSAGELHRVAIARALIAEPRILLLDEPLGPLDADGAWRLTETLAAMHDLTVVAAAPAPAGIPFRDGCRSVALGP